MYCRGAEWRRPSRPEFSRVCRTSDVGTSPNPQPVTGYERGTITPFGSATALPVIADARIVGQTISSVPVLTASPRRSLPTT